MKYGVWCEVFGGVTGSREAWLKSNGELMKFATFEEAQAEARRCQSVDRRFSTANFRYTARELN